MRESDPPATVDTGHRRIRRLPRPQKPDAEGEAKRMGWVDRAAARRSRGRVPPEVAEMRARRRWWASPATAASGWGRGLRGKLGDVRLLLWALIAGPIINRIAWARSHMGQAGPSIGPWALRSTVSCTRHVARYHSVAWQTRAHLSFSRLLGAHVASPTTVRH
ncbi:hypothetical protein E2562_037066 [Oryza meyeriana var. granulata]|uniref:Uncharacterized protein n=1 Tax=Oryza meyeriana var. granulata TaxID=110450 RepID=A0A6G1ETP5_9ORYZ|nr:hypothetical protein E2562_037066 [Oryza meyeriana var. granulata]